MGTDIIVAKLCSMNEMRYRKGENILMELRINQVTKNFQNFCAVNEFSYTLHTGVYGLLGTNGAGKTTLMQILATLIKPTSGEVLWDGRGIFTMDEKYRRLLGYVPQTFGYYPDFSVNDYLMYIAKLKGIYPAFAKQRVKEVLNQVGLVKSQHKKMKSLSGGMTRRVCIAQAMLNEPKILILDEPTAGLDPNERIRFRNLISELSEDRIVLLSTHIVSDVENIANEILLMKDGQLIISGSSEKVIASVPEKVWILHAPKAEINSYLHHKKVANVRTTSNGVELRVVSTQKPAVDSIQVETTLEDVFLYYFGESVGEDDGVV